MRILLIADGNSVWTRRVYAQIYHPMGCEVALTPLDPMDSAARAYWRERGVPVLDPPAELPLIRSIPRVRGLVQRRRELRALLASGPFDQVHVQQVFAKAAVLAELLEARGVPALLSYWGSDVFRAKPGQLEKQRAIIARAKAVAVQSVGMKEALVAAVGEGLREKIRLVTFGVDMLEDIDRALALGKPACRRALGVPEEGFLLVLGGCAIPAHQHLRALDALSRLSDAEKARLHVALPLTYGGTPEYIARVREAAQASGLRHTLLTDFLDGPHMAVLRAGCDAYAQITTTDAISASMQESLYAGVRVLNPVWLSYPELDELGYQFDTYRAFDELPAAVLRLMETEPPVQPSRAAFRAAYGWETTRALYADMMR